MSNEAEEMSTMVGKFKLNDYTGQQAAAKTTKVSKLPKKEYGHATAKLVAAASEHRNHKMAERLATNFNEDDFEKF